MQLANGLTGFVSKCWTRVITADALATAPSFTIDVADVGTGLAVMVRGADFALVYDAGCNEDLARGADNWMLSFIQGRRDSILRRMARPSDAPEW